MSKAEAIGWVAVALGLFTIVAAPVPGILIAIMGGAVVYNRRSRA